MARRRPRPCQRPTPTPDPSHHHHGPGPSGPGPFASGNIRRVALTRRLAELVDRSADRLEAAFPRGDSAVLVLVVHDPAGEGSGPGLVLTRRSADLRTDPGYVAFPGGRIDPGESVWGAAGRECEEDRRPHPRRQSDLAHFAAARGW